MEAKIDIFFLDLKKQTNIVSNITFKEESTCLGHTENIIGREMFVSAKLIEKTLGLEELKRVINAAN